MRIAQVAPLYETVPPKRYGGTERVVSYLTERLVEQGHDVTLFAIEGSVTKAHLVATCQRPLREVGPWSVIVAHYSVMLDQVFRAAAEFDVVHFHIDAQLHFPLFRHQTTPYLTSLHLPLDLPGLVPFYRHFCEIPVVSVSDAQREPLPRLNWLGTVYHGLPKDLYTFRDRPGKYLAFLGRTSPEKRLDCAIEIARRSGMELKIGAKIGEFQQHFDEVIKPLLEDNRVEFLGEIPESEKDDFFGECIRSSFSRGLAGALRPGDDRGHGMWDSGYRLSARLRARGDCERSNGFCGGGC